MFFSSSGSHLAGGARSHPHDSTDRLRGGGVLQEAASPSEAVYCRLYTKHA